MVAPTVSTTRVSESVHVALATYVEEVGVRSRVGLRSNVKWFRGGLVFKTHRHVHLSTLGSRVIMTKRRRWHLGERRLDGRGVRRAQEAGEVERHGLACLDLHRGREPEPHSRHLVVRLGGWSLGFGI